MLIVSNKTVIIKTGGYSLEFDFSALKHIVEDTKNTHFILQ